MGEVVTGKNTFKDGKWIAPPRPNFHDICKAQYKARLEQILASKQFTIIGATFCKHTQKTKELLDEKKIEYEVINMDEVYGIDQMEVTKCIFGKGDQIVPYMYQNSVRYGTFKKLYTENRKGQLETNIKNDIEKTNVEAEVATEIDNVENETV